MRPIPLHLVLAVMTAVLCSAWVGPPALASGKFSQKINANPAVAQLVKLHDKAEVLIGNNPNDPSIVNFAGEMVDGTYQDYRVIATAEKATPVSSQGNFTGVGLPLDQRAHTVNTPISITGLMKKLKGQHCHFVKKYKTISLASGLYPIIKGLYNAENKALGAAGKPKLTVPSKNGICR